MKEFFFGVISILLMGFSLPQNKTEAYSHIQNLKKGVLLVRLHSQDAMIAKMKHFRQDVARVKKIKEIHEKNKETYLAFSSVYDFSDLRFFNGRDSKKVRDGDYSNIFLDDNLEIDTSIKIPQNVPVYVLDVGDIFFPNMSGHQEGVIIMNTIMEPLKKPFPYYVRKRSGMAIIKRTDLDMAVILNNSLKTFYKESQRSRE
ncbi:MAG: hypothetical protein ACPGRC_00250 [Salibacteraceae bacterium]